MCVLRKCKKCGLEAHTEEELELFVKGTPRDRHGYRNKCRECNSKMKKEKYGSDYHYQHRYGITKEEYEKCMSTSSCCELCGTEDDLVYDHCHETGKFRMVLCRKHNAAIGMLGDSSTGLYQAYKLLKEKGY